MAKRASKTVSVVTDRDMAQVIDAALPRAKQGDMTAALLIERVWLRERTIELDLPAIIDAKSVAEAQSRLLTAVTRNRITPRAGRDISSIVENRRRSLETVEFAARLTAIEEDQTRADMFHEEIKAEIRKQ